jgi:hypothetical protein
VNWKAASTKSSTIEEDINMLNSLLETGAHVAALCKSSSITRSLELVKHFDRTGKPCITMLGANSLGGELDALSAAFSLKGVEAAKFQYIGKSCNICFQKGDVLSPDSAALAKMISGSEQTIAAACTVPSPALEQCDVHLLFSAKDFTDLDLDEENARSDYFVLYLSAVAMLNLAEKQWLNKYAAPFVGKDRLCVYLGDMQHLQESDIADLMASLRAALSAQFPDMRVFWEPEALYNHLKDDILSSVDLLREGKEALMAHNLLDLIRKTADGHIQLAKTDLNEVAQAISLLKSRKSELMTRCEALIGRLRIRLEGDIKGAMLMEMSSYAEIVDKNLTDGIRESVSLEEARNRISPFIEQAWTGYFEHSIQKYESVYQDLDESVKKEISRDVDSFIDSIDLEALDLSGMNLKTASRIDMSNFSPFSPTRERVEKISRALLYSTIPMLFVSFPLTIATFVASRYIKKWNSQKIESEEKEDLIRDALNHTRQVRQQLKSAFEEQFAKNLDDMGNGIRSIYQEFSEVLLNKLDEKYKDADAAQRTVDEVIQAVKALPA